MKSNHKLALYVAYYLARFNDEALKNLKYSTWNQAFTDIGSKLGIKKTSIKNRRDEFDPLFDFRAGWHQRPISPSRLRVVQALEDLDEVGVRSIVIDILTGRLSKETSELQQLLSIATDKLDKKVKQKFILRAPTGKAAEEFFIKYFSETQTPFKGELIDCRDFGVGYDFRIENGKEIHFIEVKGLADNSGGVLFTNKEWTVALNEGEKYILCLVTSVNTNPEITFIENPGSKINPKKNIFTSIQINWSITEGQLKSLND